MRAITWTAAGLLVVAAGMPLVGSAYAAGNDTGSSSAGGATGGGLGGYTADIISTPVSVQIYEPVIPLPVQPGKPQSEADLSFTSVSTGTGPSNSSTASSLWPGSGLGDGFTTITQTLGLGAADYPVKAEAAYPGGPPSSTQGAPPLATMTSTADEQGAKAAATVADLLPANNALVDAAQMSSTSSTTIANDKVTATTEAVAHDLSLAGGIIDIATVRTQSTVSSTADAAKSAGSLSVSGLSIAGFSFTVDQDGVHASGQGKSLPALPALGLPSQPADVLKSLGIEVTGPKVVKHEAGTTGSYQAQALQISIDTGPLKKMLDAASHYQNTYYQLINSLPDQLQQVFNNPQVPSLIELGPKIVFSLGLVSAKTTASPAFTFTLPTLPVPGPPSLPPLVGGASLPALPDTTAGDLGGAPVELPSSNGSEQGPVVASGATKASALSSTFDGLPPWTLLAVLAGAGVIGLGLRRVAAMAGMLPVGGADCRLGATTGVPNLREG